MGPSLVEYEQLLKRVEAISVQKTKAEAALEYLDKDLQEQRNKLKELGLSEETAQSELERLETEVQVLVEQLKSKLDEIENLK